MKQKGLFFATFNKSGNVLRIMLAENAYEHTIYHLISDTFRLIGIFDEVGRFNPDLVKSLLHCGVEQRPLRHLP